MKFIKIIIVVLLLLVMEVGFIGYSSRDYIQSRIKEITIQKKLATRSSKEPLKIGFTTDMHFYRVGQGKKYDWQAMNWQSRRALDRFVGKMNNEFKPDLIIDDGDLVDGQDHTVLSTWKTVAEKLGELNAPHYYVLGNHDIRTLEEPTWLELTNYQKPYYYLDVKGYRIIVLNGNYFPDGRETDHFHRCYSGGLGEEELKWLEQTLKNAVYKDKDPIVFIHQPPVKTDTQPKWQLFPQGEELHELFAKYGVRAVFSGHIERFCDFKSQQKNQPEYFVLQGLWKYKDSLKEQYRFKNAGNFYYITVTPQGTEVKTEYRIFKKRNPLSKIKIHWKDLVDHWEQTIITPEKYNCEDFSQPVKTGEEDIELEEE